MEQTKPKAGKREIESKRRHVATAGNRCPEMTGRPQIHGDTDGDGLN